MIDYYHLEYGRIFVTSGLGGKTWGVYYRKPNGSLKRVVSPALPLSPKFDVVQANLDRWATKNGLIAIQVRL